MSRNCRFCAIKEGLRAKGIIDEPLFEQKDYFALPSIGALVKGWLLVIPKKHQYNMAEYYKNDDFINYVHMIISELKKKVGADKKILVFEHGANHCGSTTGCGTDHAHLHIVPYDKSIYDKIIVNKKWTLCKPNEIEQFVENHEYLLYADFDDNLNTSKIYINIVEQPESQYFRKILANEMGEKDKFNYKEYPNEENSKATYRMFGGK